MVRSKQSALVLTSVVLGLAGFFTFCCPLVHFLPLKQIEKQEAEAVFNPTNFAAAFWQQKLLKSLDRASDLNQLLAALAADPQKARAQFGHKLGLSSSTLFFVRGHGHVVAVKRTSITVCLKDGDSSTDIVLPTGLLFGNTVRDGSGLLDANSFPNSQNFNDVSTALNHLVETRVLPQLREQARAGAAISFTGCTEVDDDDTDFKPLTVVPIAFEISSPK